MLSSNLGASMGSFRLFELIRIVFGAVLPEPCDRVNQCFGRIRLGDAEYLSKTPV